MDINNHSIPLSMYDSASSMSPRIIQRSPCHRIIAIAVIVAEVCFPRHCTPRDRLSPSGAFSRDMQMKSPSTGLMWCGSRRRLRDGVRAEDWQTLNPPPGEYARDGKTDGRRDGRSVTQPGAVCKGYRDVSSVRRIERVAWS
jgi:hypothetical protein